jgi:hypothetical protein
MNNGIVAHGVISAAFSIQLELDIFVSVDSKIDASNHPAVEFVASKAIPPIVRDIHVKALERFRPLAVDAEGCGLIARHWNHNDRM